MLSPRISPKRSPGDEAEKPFWISYADLMTAMMVLFLVVMLASLLALTQSVRAAAKINAKNQEQAEELQKIRATQQAYDELRDRVLDQLEKRAPKSVTIDRNRGVIDFGPKAQFESNRADLNSAQVRFLRSFVPDLIAIADSAPGRRTVKRIIIEGFADPRGTYLHNVHLSAARSETGLCAILEPSAPRLSSRLLDKARVLFATAGASSNSLKASNEASRRIEMRIEYFTVDEFVEKRARPRAARLKGSIGTCEASVGG